MTIKRAKNIYSLIYFISILIIIIISLSVKESSQFFVLISMLPICLIENFIWSCVKKKLNYTPLTRTKEETIINVLEGKSHIILSTLEDVFYWQDRLLEYGIKNLSIYRSEIISDKYKKEIVWSTLNHPSYLNFDIEIYINCEKKNNYPITSCKSVFLEFI